MLAQALSSTLGDLAFGFGVVLIVALVVVGAVIAAVCFSERFPAERGCPLADLLDDEDTDVDREWMETA